ncbi:MAG: biotin/lipoyl-containing protein [Terricaulis sp.]
MTDIVVPTLGESVSEATVAKWLKKAGDAVKKDETLVELETDKVSVEVSAPEAGTLTDIVAAEGATVGIGAILGHLGNGAAASAKPAAAPAAKPAAAPAAAKPAPQPARRRQTSAAPRYSASSPRTASTSKTSPAPAGRGASPSRTRSPRLKRAPPCLRPRRHRRRA